MIDKKTLTLDDIPPVTNWDLLYSFTSPRELIGVTKGLLLLPPPVGVNLAISYLIFSAIGQWFIPKTAYAPGSHN